MFASLQCPRCKERTDRFRSGGEAMAYAFTHMIEVRKNG